MAAREQVKQLPSGRRTVIRPRMTTAPQALSHTAGGSPDEDFRPAAC
jgi:hypothetical protein